MTREEAMEKLKIALRILAALLFIACLSWLGDVFRAASFLPWYKLLGAGALCLVVAGVAILYVKDDWERERERRKGKEKDRE